ncbi:xanthine dehydrogenase family protein subunit M [Glaciihabitans sp. dw_435]|uniref:FAD binding domain-containing protein n=1 Tax=Glaciihabitans sp. dw_435 TaxID=2720081 RepID=UPI001BD31525|nr:FAD binding domain-containing protein [Glaciihabitans sp. dw_435]
MDLITVREIRVPRTREEISFAPGEIPLGGGTWLFSEVQEGITGLVDLTGLGWQPIEVTDENLVVAATCTIAEFSRLPAQDGWTAHPLISQCVNSLLASFKIWNVATVGGNICTSLPAGPMISLAAALDATAVIWTIDGHERRMPIASFVTGVRENELAPGEILRAIEYPLENLRSRTAFRRIALSTLGRTGTLVIGRLDADGSLVVTISGGTYRPRQLRFDELPDRGALASAVASIHEWYSDAHGAPDWRHAMSAKFAEEIRIELGGIA